MQGASRNVQYRKDFSLPTRNRQGEEMFAAPPTIGEQSTQEFLTSQHSAALGWGMADINQGPLTNLVSMDMPSIPTHAEAFQAAAPNYCNAFNTKKRMAMVTPGGSQDSTQHTKKFTVTEDYWKAEQDDASMMVEQASITGRDDTMLDATGTEAKSPATQLSTTTQLHNEQEMLIKMAAAMGVELAGDQAQKNLDKFLSTPITTVGAVLKLMTTFHTGITQVELKSHAMTVEVMLDIFGDKIVSMHKELTWLGKEHRTTQKQRASVQVILSGWPENCDAEERNGFIRWMCREVETLRKLLFTWYAYDVDKDPTLITHILQIPPTTLSYPGRNGYPRFSPITILTFTNFDARQEFLKTYMGWQPEFEWSNGHRTDKKIRTAPASPDFQRQLEVPLRTVHKVLNTAPTTKGKQFVTLWKTLTVMEPQDQTHYDENHNACFRLEYTVHKSTGDVVAEMHITEELAKMMKLKFDTVAQKVAEDPEANTLWQSCWKNQVSGREQEVNDATVDANNTVRTEGAYEIGKHWTAEFTRYTNTLFPFKIKLIVYPSDMDINYDLEEYKRKLKNVTSNKEAREKNATKSGYTNWENKGQGWYKVDEGQNSQSSAGVSPSAGTALTQSAGGTAPTQPDVQMPPAPSGPTASPLLEPDNLQPTTQPSQPQAVLPPGNWHQKDKGDYGKAPGSGKGGGKSAKGKEGKAESYSGK